jgi:hypothetical protein
LNQNNPSSSQAMFDLRQRFPQLTLSVTHMFVVERPDHDILRFSGVSSSISSEFSPSVRTFSLLQSIDLLNFQFNVLGLYRSLLNQNLMHGGTRKPHCSCFRTIFTVLTGLFQSIVKF